MIMEGSSETVNDSQKNISENNERSDSNSNKQQLLQHQEAVVVMNTMGFLDPNLLNKQMQKSIKKKESAPKNEADF